jgi:hypothetical protein
VAWCTIRLTFCRNLQEEKETNARIAAIRKREFEIVADFLNPGQNKE